MSRPSAKVGGKKPLVERFFTKKGEDFAHVVAGVEWGEREAFVVDHATGEDIYRQKVSFPKSWSQQAVNITASKYFAGRGDQREKSLEQLLWRVVMTTSKWAVEQKLIQLGSGEEADTFEAELTYVLLHQLAAFNSPVWFNLGVPNRRQAVSACYIQSVDDTMESIRDLYTSESLLFCDGSGSGTNFSRLRASGEPLSGGGASSGPMAFIQGLDAASGAIKSGGKTRRAAKMVVLNVDHPDVFDFVECKSRTEDMAAALIAAGFNGDFSDPENVYSMLPFQNANNSVRVTDEFMKVVEKDWWWNLVPRTVGETRAIKARDLWADICYAAWRCGDPGLQFDTTINAWHTCKASGRINASNPCSEYVFIDDSACNLASINLVKVMDRPYKLAAYQQVVQVMITAMETFVGKADYPTEKIRQNSHDFRPLGLGYANLGALLMKEGLAYDSDAGRARAAELTREMHWEAYAQSARIAELVGPFPKWEENRESFMEVLQKHNTPEHILREIRKHGLRNAQVTVLAPTGTIGFMMDCDTTGIEPCLALTTYKKLVGGGSMKIVNETAQATLKRLGYVLNYADADPSIDLSKILKPEHVDVFRCALDSAGLPALEPMAHVRMMAAVQPYLSGAISKTVNMPNSATEEDIADVYIQAWKMGVKAIAVYRDGCKSSQPASAAPAKSAVTEKDAQTLMSEFAAEEASKLTFKTIPAPKKLPTTRQSKTHKFKVAGQTGFVTVGMFEDGTPGEIFVSMSKQGSLMSGLLDAWAITMSVALQNGVPLAELTEHLAYMRFEPSGWTGNKDLVQAHSVVDYIVRWIDLEFSATPADEPKPEDIEPKDGVVVGHLKSEHLDDLIRDVLRYNSVGLQIPRVKSDAPLCRACGSQTERSGSCYRCPGCGETTGCS